jgi:DNA invertase Pin-like site-specific DNA recombinase
MANTPEAELFQSSESVGSAGRKIQMNVALYVRVSTHDQNCELQLRELKIHADRENWNIVEVYRDVMSGAARRRPGLDRLLADAASRKFDCIVCWKLDRFGRSLVDCLNNIQLLESYGVRFIAVTQALDTDQRNPASRFLLHVLGAAAEFERSLIAERIQAGRLRYQQDFESGKVGVTVHSRSGRNLAPHRPKKVFDRHKVVELRGQGLSVRQIAKRLGLSIGTTSRTLRSCSKSMPTEKNNLPLSTQGLPEDKPTV